MGHHQETVAMRQANDDATVLFLRVVGVRYGRAESITEDSRSFAECDFVLADILRFLFRIPLKFHTGSVTGLSPFANPVMAF